MTVKQFLFLFLMLLGTCFVQAQGLTATLNASGTALTAGGTVYKIKYINVAY